MVSVGSGEYGVGGMVTRSVVFLSLRMRWFVMVVHVLGVVVIVL